MSGYVYNLSVKLKGKQDIAKITQLLSDMDSEVLKIGKDSQVSGNNMKSAFAGAKREVLSLAAQIGAISFVKNSLSVAAEVESFESTIKFASGTTAEANKNFEFLDKTINDLKIPIRESQLGFKTLLGSVKGTNISMDTTRSIFQSVAKGSRVLGVSADKTSNIFTALGQMASKGGISMEELKSQLGDALPGTMAIAARSMNMPIQKFQKLVETGKLAAGDFLPRFAREMDKTFSSGVPSAVNTASANFVDLNNQLFRLQNTIGKELIPTVIPLINDYLIPAVKWVGANIKTVKTLAIAVGSAYVANKLWTFGAAAAAVTGKALRFTYLLMTSSLLRYKIITPIVTFWTGKLAIAQKALNFVMNMNPYVRAATLLAGLVTVVISAWKNFDKFRGFVVGLGRAIKEFANSALSFIMRQIGIFGKILKGVFTLDFDLLKQGLTELDNQSIIDGVRRSARRMGIAFNEGFNSEVNVKRNLAAGLAASAKKRGGAVAAAFAAMRGGGTGGDVSLKNNPEIKSGIEAITGGGSKTINTTIQKMFAGDVNISSQTAGEGVDEMLDMMLRKLLQVTNRLNTAQ